MENLAVLPESDNNTALILENFSMQSLPRSERPGDTYLLLHTFLYFCERKVLQNFLMQGAKVT
jgi:hypothetical protein